MKNNTIMYIIAALIVGVVIGLYLPNKTDNSVSTTSINKVEIQKVINEKLIQGGLKATVENRLTSRAC
jgi:multisubunit Na+/H+ antiporter MnhB subunit